MCTIDSHSSLQEKKFLKENYTRKSTCIDIYCVSIGEFENGFLVQHGGFFFSNAFLDIHHSNYVQCT